MTGIVQVSTQVSASDARRAEAASQAGPQGRLQHREDYLRQYGARGNFCTNLATLGYISHSNIGLTEIEVPNVH